MNKTREIYDSLLQELQEKTIGPDKIISRKYTSSNGIGLIYSVFSGERMRALAIPSDKTLSETQFPVWKGVKIYLASMPEYDDPSRTYIVLQQITGTEAYIFEIVVENLRRVVETLSSSKGTADTVLNVLKKWEFFFSHGRVPLLTASEAQGLYGELLFLEGLIQRFGLNAVNTWYSEKNTHDFYIGQHGVEVKTSDKQAPYYAHINSEYQLDDSDVNGHLYLKMYALRSDRSGGQKLSELIWNIRDLLKSDIAVLNIFDKKLQTLGYFDAAEDYYYTGYTLRDVYLFEVKPGFPRLVKKDIPNGIYHIEYDISISEGMNYAVEDDEFFRKLEE